MTSDLSVKSIVHAVAAVTGVSPDEIYGVHRTVSTVRARHLAMYLATVYCTRLSLPAIGRLMGGRDHTTIIHARDKIAQQVEEAGDAEDLMEIKSILSVSQNVLSRIGMNDTPDPDPLEIAERASTDHGVARITYDEIRVLAAFVINIVNQDKLINETDDSDLQATMTLARAALRVVKRHRAFVDARFGAGEGSSLTALSSAIEMLEVLYLRDVGPIPMAQPTFKTSSNAPRKEAHLG